LAGSIISRGPVKNTSNPLIKKKKKKKKGKTELSYCAPGSPQVSLGWLDATLVEARTCVYANRISQVGQGVAYEEIGGLMRVRRGSTE
jgi:hypothetical protein